tara:strand:- start:261 stop:926 length:666 start_codon:yes stop_codon:yes gene_type:complete
MKGLKKLFILIGQIFLYLIGIAIILASAQMFAKWSLAVTLTSNFWYLVFIPPLGLLVWGILSVNKRLRDKTKKVFLNLFKNLNNKSQLLVPKNKLARLALNSGFVPVWFHIYGQILDYYYPYGGPDHFIFFILFLIPIFFYTRFLWFEKSRNRIFYGLIDKLKFLLKQLFDKFKFNLKQFNSEVFNTTSNADELKKYAELRDQGVITEEEFQAKKRQLLDL